MTNQNFRGGKRTTIVTAINNDIKGTKENSPWYPVTSFKSAFKAPTLRKKIECCSQIKINQVIESAYTIFLIRKFSGPVSKLSEFFIISVPKHP